MKCIRVVPKENILKNKLFLTNAKDNSGHCVLRENVGHISIQHQIRMKLNVKLRSYG